MYESTPCQTGKAGFPSKKEAELKINGIYHYNKKFQAKGQRMKRLSRNVIPTRTYLCESCNQWHLTSETIEEYEESKTISKRKINHWENFKKYLQNE